MSCLYPVKCFRAVSPNENGKRPLAHTIRQARSLGEFTDFTRPCGQCIECRLQKSRYTAVRCVHEASCFDDNSFITLTFDDQFLPSDLSLCSRTMQLFWKKLRKRTGAKFKYFAVGEYGDGEGVRPINPHYHACIFGFDFGDRRPAGRGSDGHDLFQSALLDDVWGYGRCRIGEVNFETAAYCARYTLKKVYGDKADAHYAGRMPERSWSSIGLGKTWFDKWYSDVYPSDVLVIRGGSSCMPPPYYDRLLLKYDPVLYDDVVNARELKIKNSTINVDLVRNPMNGRTMNVSEVVRRARLRVGGLDKSR